MLTIETEEKMEGRRGESEGRAVMGIVERKRESKKKNQGEKIQILKTQNGRNGGERE